MREILNGNVFCMAKIKVFKGFLKLFPICLLIIASSGCNENKTNKPPTTKVPVIETGETTTVASKNDFLSVLDSSTEIFMDANSKRNRPEGNRITLNSEQKTELSKQLANLEKTEKKITSGTPVAGLPIDFFICAIHFNKKDGNITTLNYYSPGRIESPDGAIWQSSIPQDFDNFIKSLKFRFPMLGPNKHAGDP